MPRLVAIAIAIVVVGAVALLAWVYFHPTDSSTDALAFVFVPLYALGAIIAVLVLWLIARMVDTGLEIFRRDERRV